ncbi:MAG: class 1 isoprenoid biosynthesis enzyme [Kiritimatiellia bacterium]
MTTAWKTLFETGRIARAALREQQECIREIHARLAPHLASPADTPAAYEVRPAPRPDANLGWRKNIFSTLFPSVYHLMDVPAPRRLLYGKLIHLFRIWVTSADNLLDGEDKEVVPVVFPGNARVMRQVVAVMAADRVLAEILNDAVAAGTLTAVQRDELARESLCRLLPSAAQEATEEGGIAHRPPPEEVLDVIHRLKTGLLFNVAFVGPEIVEPLAFARTARLRAGLMDFGLGCQVLDDVRDMARDLLEKRHNLVLSVLAHQAPDRLAELAARVQTPADRIYLDVPQYALPAARQGFDLMATGLRTLGEAGLGYDGAQAESMARAMFPVLDLEGLPIA